MLWRGPRGRPLSAPAAFIPPCLSDCRQTAPFGAWLGARAEARRLSAADSCPRWTGAPLHHEREWLDRAYPDRKEATGLREPLIIDAEVVHLSAKGVADFDALHSRTADEKAVALAFDLLLAGDDLRRRPLLQFASSALKAS